MEQLLIFILVALGSGLSSYLQKKKKREAEQGRPPSTGQPPVPPWPRDWQEELRRLLQGETAAPPVPPAPPRIPPQPAKPTRAQPAPARRPVQPVASEVSEGSVVFSNPLTQSQAAYDRASHLAGRVEQRLQAVDAQTKAHKGPRTIRQPLPSGAVIARRWTASRESLRQAFIASLILAPPVGLKDQSR